MTLDQRLALARELIARRDEIDAELEALFKGGMPARKHSRKCKMCGEPGHRSDACPQAQSDGNGSTADADGLVVG